MIGSQDLLIALAIGLFFFGAKRLPELARGLGESLKEFKKGVAANEPEPPAMTSAPSSPSDPSSAAPPRRCMRCQTELQGDWSHCPKCGAAAGSAEPSPT
jgi:sec-independent protein translocase protein TatA